MLDFVKDFLHALITPSEYTRWRITHRPAYRLGMGCLGLLFLLCCLGTLLVIYFMPVQ